MVGREVSAVPRVVKEKGKAAPSGVPFMPVAPVVILPVNAVLGAKADEGLKAPIILVAS
jgi:hypothetical protein